MARAIHLRFVYVHTTANGGRVICRSDFDLMALLGGGGLTLEVCADTGKLSFPAVSLAAACLT